MRHSVAAAGASRYPHLAVKIRDLQGPGNRQSSQLTSAADEVTGELLKVE
jgi:hypothetical protein